MDILSILADNEVVFIILGIVAFFAGIIVLVIIAEKKRVEGLLNLSRKMGFSFQAKVKENIIDQLSNFKLFTFGHSKKVYNLLKGRYNSIRWMIFDYRYTVGGGKSSRTYNQTVACVTDEEFKLPKFTIGPENFLHKIGDKLGMKDIDFEHNKNFSDKYYLKGDDENRIREIFNHQVLSFFENNNSMFNIEVDNNKMLFYRSSKRVKPVEFQTFLDDVSKSVKIFK